MAIMTCEPQVSADAALPWVEVVEGECRESDSPSTAISSEAGGKVRGLFAARVTPLPLEERTGRRWGFNSEALYQEAESRQQQFLAGLHDGRQFEYRRPPVGPTLALHLLSDPANERVTLCVLGAVDGRTTVEAREKAIDLWRTVAATFPYDYEVKPVLARGDFLRTSGLALVEQIAAPDEIAEVQRFEMRVSTGRGPALLLGLWQGNKRADEQVWRALTAAPQPTLLSVRVQPTHIATAEWPRLQAVLNFAPFASEIETPAFRQHYRWAADIYDKRLRSWMQPFLLQVHVAAPGGVPVYLRRALGSAMTFRADSVAPPGYQIVTPSSESVTHDWRQALRRLSFTRIPSTANNNFLYRLHMLASIEEALTVFRWPYPPKEELPGVRFE